MENKTNKDEGFAGFIGEVENVVTLTPPTSNIFSETIPQPTTETGLENVTPAPEQTKEEDSTTKKPEKEFNVKKLFLVCLGLFVLSSLGAIFSHVVPFFFAIAYLWFIAAGISLISVIVLFLIGIIRGFTGDSFKTVGIAIIFLVVLGVAGFGTCALNLSSAGV